MANPLSFIKYQPIGLRVWHWFNAAVITGLLLTVGLRRTLFSGRAITKLIESKTADAGVTLDHEVAKDIANTMVDRLWDWHVYLGYALGTLLLLRILVAFIHNESPFRWCRLGYQQFRVCPPQGKKESLHYVAVRSGYLAFYLATLFMVLSGLVMVYNDNILHLPSDFIDQLHDVHEAFQYFFLAFVIIHIAGVVIGELGRYGGIVSNMIHGGSKKT